MLGDLCVVSGVYMILLISVVFVLSGFLASCHSMAYTDEEKFILALDIGTTNLKCGLFTKRMETIRFSNEKMNVKCSRSGAVEIIPDDLWTLIVESVEKLKSAAGISSPQIACIGISSQRGTFTAWNRRTGQTFFNLITWKDVRAADDSYRWNHSLIFRLLKLIFYGLYLISGSERFLAGSKLKFAPVQVTMRLLWALKNNSAFKAAVRNGTAMFGTLDTWLLYRLTNGKSYCSDYSCSSATGMYDPFTLSWSFFLKILGVPYSTLPPVCDSVGTHFGCVNCDLWGSEIPVTCCIADQSASTYCVHCTKCGDVKLTLGTGAFLSVTVGEKMLSNKNESFYPLICWKYDDIQTCVLEGAFSDCGALVDWAHRTGYFDEVTDLSRMAESVPDSSGVYLNSALVNSQAREVDSFEAAFIGASAATKKVHFIRAVLESIIFQVYRLYLTSREEFTFINQSAIRVNGGVSNNDFVCQGISDVCGVVVSRPYCVEASIRGAALLAGSAIGLCDVNVIDQPDDKIFLPNHKKGKILRMNYNVWSKYQSR